MYPNIEVEVDNCSICQDYLGQYNAIKGDSDVQHSFNTGQKSYWRNTKATPLPNYLLALIMCSAA